MTATVNIGLAVRGGGHVSPSHALATLKTVGGARPLRATVQQSDSEPTLVVEIDRPLYAASAFAVADALQQDAIAQFDGRSGDLYGPNASAWGHFDPALFVTLDGHRLDAPLNAR